jgi:N-methylhydantoinase A/oxoprolinase/acetone carboxylase beta subunit
VAVPLGSADADPGHIYEQFERLHERLYGTRLGDPAEIVNIRVTVTGEVSRLTLKRFQPDGGSTGPISSRQTAFYPDPLPVYWRDSLPPGWSVDHSCLIEEVDSVLYLPGGQARVDDYGNIRFTWGHA